MNSKFSKQWFWERKAMKELSVHGAGAVLARISERFGRRLHCELMLLGIDTVSGRDCGWYSAMVIFTSSSSGSAVDEVGDEAVEEAVRIDNEPSALREFIMLLRSCLYTRRAELLLWLSRPSQEQSWGLYG